MSFQPQEILGKGFFAEHPFFARLSARYLPRFGPALHSVRVQVQDLGGFVQIVGFHAGPLPPTMLRVAG
ncbi:MAG: hypothetical protein WCY91_10000 [Acidithiobacillus sp.]|nr:hypothetical protein [Acidithiobacillus sp.]